MRRRLELQSKSADSWEVAGARKQVIGERAGEKLAVVVMDQLFQQRAAKSLRDRAHALAVQGDRIDDSAASSTAT